jgi:poly-gamma-glutamate synthesis protein (capsule biosynthesis protein)
LLATGDIGPDRPDPSTSFDLIRDDLSAAEIVFGQLELPLTEGGTRLPQARHAVRGPIATAPALKGAGFNVLSFASNHCMDWGSEALLETIDRLGAEQLKVVGAGRSIVEAREPAVIELSSGRKVAILAYCSILPQDYWAEANRPGCAPLRAHTLYEQIEHDQPGTPCRIHTFAHASDLQAMIDDIRAARAKADHVVVSVHWGIHFVPAALADYQREAAHAAIDAGADAVLGHHAHILKAVEVYRGRPIYYSLCNFAIDLRMTPQHAAGRGFREIQALSPGWEVDFDSLYNFPPDSRMTMVAKIKFADDGQIEAGYLPAYVNDQAQPRLLRADEREFREVVDYVDKVTRAAGISTEFAVDGNEVRLSLESNRNEGRIP